MEVRGPTDAPRCVNTDPNPHVEGGGIETGSFSAATETTLEFGHSWWAFDSGAGVSGCRRGGIAPVSFMSL